MHVLGISAFYHDSAAALVTDGRIVAAAQEERFTRKRHDAAFPANAVRYCLESSGAVPDRVIFYEKPFLKFERLIETALAVAPHGFAGFRHAIPLWLGGKLLQKRALIAGMRAIDRSIDWALRLGFSEHHLSHLASAFYPSPFEEAAILTIDGVGEWTTTSLAHGQGSRIEILSELHFPHSLGLLYAAVTYHLGFKVNSGEYKVMGLAPYGEPTLARRLLDEVIDLKPDGSFRLDQRFFNYCTGLTMTAPAFDALAGGPRRTPEAPLEQRHFDLAASLQAVTEEVMLRLAGHAQVVTGSRNLCLAGGVALNCVANARVRASEFFDRLWIQPAAGDAGGALGAALLGSIDAGLPRQTVDAMLGSLLGPDFSQAEIEQRLRTQGAVFETLAPDILIDRVAAALARGLVVGWMQGRTEFGPRALGARSILADPRDATMQERLNEKIKHRESFRPFAPAVLVDQAAAWFENATPSPFMLLTFPVTKDRRGAIPAVTHVDGSARVQTVARDTNPRFHDLLAAFNTLTGCPMLINTSFNLRGEPIVCTPEDAFRCFMATGIDILTIGDCYLEKPQQDMTLASDYSRTLEPD